MAWLEKESRKKDGVFVVGDLLIPEIASPNYIGCGDASLATAI